MSNYSATVVQIDNIRPHGNANRLQLTTIFGNTVVIGLDTKIGDVGLMFPLESQLGLEFCQVNDLMRRKDENGKPAGGMFDANRRVRAQTLRGERSMGFFMPIESLLNLGFIPSDLPAVGEELETWKGFDISKKYVVPTTAREQVKQKGPKLKKKEDVILPDQFRFHQDTSHYGKNAWKIKPDSLISITWKTHGTSLVVGNVLVRRELNFLERIAQRLGIKVQDTEYAHVNASRKVIKSVEGEQNKRNPNHFYSIDLWSHAGNQFKGKLKKGEQIYAELVGYLPNSDSMIQKDYDYSCTPGTYKIQLYRATLTSPDGSVVDMPHRYVQNRALELGVEAVPEIYYGYAKDFLGWGLGQIGEVPEEFSDALFKIISEKYVYDQDCHLCKNKVPAEGVVIRIENAGGSIENLKHKNFAFALRESKQLDTGEADLESSQSEVENTEVN